MKRSEGGAAAIACMSGEKQHAAGSSPATAADSAAGLFSGWRIWKVHQQVTILVEQGKPLFNSTMQSKQAEGKAVRSGGSCSSGGGPGGGGVVSRTTRMWHRPGPFDMCGQQIGNGARPNYRLAERCRLVKCTLRAKTAASRCPAAPRAARN